MPNFSEEIKNEITSAGFDTEGEELAALCAFIRTSGTIVSKAGIFGFELVTENEHTADFFEEILTDDFGIVLNTGSKSDVLTGKDKFTFSAANEESSDLLRRIGILGSDENGDFINFGISDAIADDDALSLAYIKGAFLGGGSCTIPDDKSYSSTGYHFEIVFSNLLTAREFNELLCGFDILAKLISRKDNAVVYVKSKEVISDILDLMSAEDSRMRLARIVEEKDMVNNFNRVNNCSVSNIDKTVTASVNQVRAIETIAQTKGLKNLDRALFEVAEARLADKNASMKELAERLDISKSCLNHRMRKLIAMAKDLED